MSDEQDLIRKISGLLAKAEGTDNEHEAKAFYEKAHDMMMRHAIEEARIRAAQTDRSRIEDPIVEDYMFSSYAHYRQAKSDLITIVAKTHSVYLTMYDNRKDSNFDREGNRGLHESQWCRLVGYADDIANVKMLYVSLLIQSQKFANEDWRLRYGESKITNDFERIGKFTWVSSHMQGFAEQIGRRFRELTEDIYKEVKDGNALMIDKDANILEWMYEHGILRRPTVQTVFYCWTSEPESNRPLTKKGTPNTKWRAKYCLMKKPANDVPHEGEHQFTYDTGPERYSYYVSKGGREKSYEGQQAGRSSANRADIGLTRVGNDAARLRG